MVSINLTSLFKEDELDIVIQLNTKAVHYLDVIINLENSTYLPYQTENNQITIYNLI